MGRKTDKELELLKKRFDVDDIWSWSRYNCYKNSPYEFYLKYIKKQEPDNDTSIYTYAGGGCHEILEDFYNKKIKYEDMLPRYEDLMFRLTLEDKKYNRIDSVLNDKIGSKYDRNMKRFFNEHKTIMHKVVIEKFIHIKVGKYLFQGYVDLAFKDKINDIYYICDWKTSSLYTGEKLLKESGQLKLYTLGLVQQGVPLEKIKFGWNFLKYSKDKYENIVDREKNEDVVDDAWVFLSITHEELSQFAKDVESDLDKINDKIRNYEKFKNEDMWLGEIIDDSNVYYFDNLCSYSEILHKPYKEYLEFCKSFY